MHTTSLQVLLKGGLQTGAQIRVGGEECQPRKSEKKCWKNGRLDGWKEEGADAQDATIRSSMLPIIQASASVFQHHAKTLVRFVDYQLVRFHCARERELVRDEWIHFHQTIGKQA